MMCRAEMKVENTDEKDAFYKSKELIRRKLNNLQSEEANNQVYDMDCGIIRIRNTDYETMRKKDIK